MGTPYTQFQSEADRQDQEAFCQAWLHARQSEVARQMLLWAPTFHLSGVFQALLASHLPGVDNFVWFHGSLLVLTLFTCFLAIKGIYSVSLATYIGGATLVGYLAIVAFLPSPDPMVNQIVFIVVASMMSWAFAVAPFANRQASWFSVALVSTAMIGIVINPQYLLPFAELVVAVVFGITWRIYRNSHLRREAAIEYRNMKRVVPRQLLRHGPPSELKEVFQPADRECICITSDWRGYQAMSARHSSDDMTALLSGYYEMCENLLDAHFPDGNYFSDWIADELFVVVFAEKGAIRDADISGAVSFAAALIHGKQGYCQALGLEEFGIDVGLAQGEAYMGLLGPPGHTKSTALGEVPGLSRRVQTTGKLLRAQLGECDRVIFTDQEAFGPAAPRRIRRFTSDRPLRDLGDQSLYYFEVESEPLPVVA